MRCKRSANTPRSTRTDAGKVPLIYEPLNRYETNLCCNMAAGVELIQSSGATNVKLLADLFHLNIEEVDIAAAIKAAGAHVGHVHFVDSNRRAADEGHLDYAPIVAALARDQLQRLRERRSLALARSARRGRAGDHGVSTVVSLIAKR